MSKKWSFHLVGAALLLLILATALLAPSDNEAISHLNAIDPEQDVSSSASDAVRLENEVTDPDPRAQEALRILVQTHPHPDIRNDLNHLIESGEVWLNFQEDVLHDSRAVAAVMAISIPGREGFTLTLSVRPSVLLDNSISLGYKQLVIYHEYIHVRQVREGRVSIAIFIPTRPERVTEAFYREHVPSELEAYERECQLAGNLGIVDQLNLCQEYAQDGRAALQRIVIYNMQLQVAQYPRQLAALQQVADELGIGN